MTDNNSMAYYKTDHVGRIGMFEPNPSYSVVQKMGNPVPLVGDPVFRLGGPFCRIGTTIYLKRYILVVKKILLVLLEKTS